MFLIAVLHKAGVNVVGYDVFPAARAAYAAEGGSVASSIHECTSGADVLILVVVSAAQISDILFAEGALAALGPEAAIIVMSTIAGADARSLGGRIAALRPDVNLLDCPASGSVARAAAGDLLVLVGGLDETSTSSHKAFHVLSLMSRSAGNNHLVLVGAVGQGSAAKLANQHLAGTQISCVAEMLALATKAGMNPRPAHTLLLSGPGWAWVLGHRGESMLQGLTTPPLAAVDILVKDMGIVVAEARALAVSVPLAALAQQQFVFAKSLGWGGDDDSG
jgi:3-hydroxyisobutyrate dehydrogenase